MHPGCTNGILFRTCSLYLRHSSRVPAQVKPYFLKFNAAHRCAPRHPECGGGFCRGGLRPRLNSFPRVAFDYPSGFCHTEISVKEPYYGKEAHRSCEACRQEGLGEAPEVHDLHRSRLQKAEQRLAQPSNLESANADSKSYTPI